MKWYQEKKLFEEFQKNIDAKYPTLNVFLEEETVYVRGTLSIEHRGVKLGEYKVEIELPDDYPENIPKVREIGGKLRRSPELHVNYDGTACLFFRDLSFEYHTRETPIVEFIEKAVKGFFIWQIDYKINGGVSSFSQWKHAEDGTYQFYCEELGTENINTIVEFLKFLTSKKTLINRKCYCGSGKRLRECHINKVKDLRKKIKRKNALISLEEMSLVKARFATSGT